ncbi:sulfur carrier protein ThiS [Alkalisalibacterium limincola]|uniref:Sulfur carrier protein ThiS n=1 Tax=Alkalisalibacterium limincola TaxID=2699169 RepID=A0A5C8KQ87_9GAMM|nr:sulfur carrier protein ThiS [Alkalisalibacterium limincola]TXK62551.1 sulfur carrier protein ThiS [Alkalisalibacterium limincola]
MQIQLNGEPTQIPDSCSIEQLLERAGLGQRRVAVEVNREVVPRSRHGEHLLAEGDRVEVVHALGGG